MTCCGAGLGRWFGQPPPPRCRRDSSVPVVTTVDKDYILVNNGRRVAETYDVDENCIGEGGFGTVSKVTCKKTGKCMVMKTMTKDSIPDVRLFQNEIHFQAECDHPHIARLYETFEDRKMVYVVMESCDGGEILDIIEEQDIGELDAWHIFHQLVGALVYLHTKVRLAHRDLKPENFLIKEKGQPLHESNMKLIDFGFAQHFEPGEKSLKTKCGTPFYMCPEILEGNYDETCDIWSSGVILYLLLSGELPFNGDSVPDILASVKSGVMSFAEEAWDRVDPSAKDLIREMCSLDPSARPSALELLDKTWMTRGREEFEQEEEVAVTKTLTRTSSELAEQFKKYHDMNPFKKAALSAIGRVIEDKDISVLRATFQQLDIEGDGTISVSTLKKVLCQTGGICEEDVEIMCKDVAAEGEVSYSNFLAANVRRKSYLKEGYCWQAFRMFDRDGDGSIDIDEFRSMVQKQTLTTDWKLNPEKAEAVFRKFDKSGDERVDFEEFMQMVSGSSDEEDASTGKKRAKRFSRRSVRASRTSVAARASAS